MPDLMQPILDLDNLNLILDNLKLGIIAHTPERIITVFNKEAERITGYSKKEVIGKDCHIVFESPFCGGKCSFCDGIPDFSSGSKEYPLNIVTKEGSARQLEMTVAGIISHDNIFKGVLASFRDVTETFNLSLKAENISSFAGIIGKDKIMQDIFRQIRDVALYNYPVHVSGDTGTGKERVAYAIHDISAYGNGAFVPVNCGAIPEGIVESELFGHVKGAFSGAIKERKGRFELAHKGTLFLDEVADLPLKTQVKLLRFLQEGSFEKVGGEKKVSVDVRIISAANKNLKKEVTEGRFREDLFYRLNVIPIQLPPLRLRKNDIPLLAAHFLKEAEQESPNSVPQLADDALDIMLDYHWPGNVRELKNAIQFSVVRSRGSRILPSDLPMEIIQDIDLSLRVSDRPRAQQIISPKGKLDIESVKAAIKKTGGNKSKAARVLGVGRATLYRFLAQNEETKNYVDQF
ncbi:MAG: sigma 54-interacting transcriptional regulator [Desulfobacula sp.]|jgi:sigma-54 dependent transcriptional regulator, acetoin dehydrogenase operon transcriptional activator AcoR|uniref:sigma-54 interaction domain-containing protein n=1 Tax=Desulfobacula sp. TaxID=2593537 RepID=UPI001D80350D|nr:sigma 54-interacting transcriptional regulator [Desulfobacula sp.]MBT4024245.1 sigma 54-interacting transcriptional regulator [Desulfobacula sp.]MBT4876806.1 sigma 54-interacting transcriptional regulator [Desulfobacula sp.]MBT5543466.1 sigma 54-interacting transcriptional regulator [Desulfobacula sp.]MBT7794174.1 sigma 54-interacting transcriptional regulator [Desulfobacula sp.]